ncbi:hypothetical protein EUGRSUZ_G00889 [Eucalyptus grandis]|uniref:Uncharacterized protein n=2 Tax=Eucalyptus grandis TaxID=71139 RepID=A0ACC3K1M5_EUCGR|nr:hypothetical protein EUGRSUZ_G00889 [Eucalyptus grandis]
MQHYSIGHGHLIVFKYKGSSTFRVMIFNKSSSEIDYSSSSISNLGSGFISPEWEDVIEMEDSEDSASHQKMRVEPHSPCSQLSPSCSSQDLEDGAGQSRSRASHSKPVSGGSMSPWPLSSFELASKFDSEYPFFKVVMRPSYMKKEAYVPRRFIIQHILEIKEIVTLRHSGRSWPVKLWSNPRSVHGAAFSSGWGAFVRGTRLHVGNVCVFELIDRDDIVFRVYIFSSKGTCKQSKCRVNHLEPVFHDPAPPRPLTTPELARDFDSEHPFFKLVIRECHLKTLSVPDRFIRQHIRENKGTATLRYSDRSWPEMPACLSSSIGKIMCSKSPSSATAVRTRFTLIEVITGHVTIGCLQRRCKSRISNYASSIQQWQIDETETLFCSWFLVFWW